MENISYYAVNLAVAMTQHGLIYRVMQNLFAKNICGWFDGPGSDGVEGSGLFYIIDSVSITM